MTLDKFEGAEARRDLEGLLHNDPQASTRVVTRFNPMLRGVARRTFATYGFESADVDDVVAETWKQVLADNGRVIRKCLERGFFPQTICAMARNRSIDLIRRDRPSVPFQPAHEALIEPQEDQPQFDRERLAGALRHLPRRERLLVRLFFLQGLKYREIADLTGIPQNSIGPTLSRALQRLRSHLTA